ncbi:hypothetical protein [Rhodococcus sp. IEGM 1379]|uniref:hypothetical protein n=1 Tax=Rhodococcus sp. IEGM 1379 TaxID=3047086 RepID=UPI0024B72F4F|nr:hypothetical protein [Rhodococcus sp. IEGM 1379]MDI9913860.1 hypothetical protein [Rhodococcus sp. IEGM 1379]
MGLTRIGRVSARPLLVRCVVVLVPLSAILVLCAVLWPNGRIRLEILPALTAEVTVILVPITTDAGERLEHNSPCQVYRIGESGARAVGKEQAQKSP